VKKFAYLIPAVLTLAACSAHSTNTATSTTTAMEKLSRSVDRPQPISPTSV
jgi:hypothetical protein